jgi:hypothetical protein
MNAVMQRLATARLPDRLTLFVPAANLPAGGSSARGHPDAPGTPLVAPPSLAATRIWEMDSTDSDAIRVLVPQAVPVRREGATIQRVTVDGAGPAGPVGAPADLRCWIDLPAWPEGPQPGPVMSGTP